MSATRIQEGIQAGIQAGTQVPQTLGCALGRAARRLARAGVPGAHREARLLAAVASGLDAAAVFGHPERPLAPDAARLLDRLARRRAAGEPLAYILGFREFWSLPFRVTADVLIPGPILKPSSRRFSVGWAARTDRCASSISAPAADVCYWRC